MGEQALVWTDMDSSNVQSVAYNKDTKKLAVRFVGGGLYSYSGVDDETFVSFVHAESVGKYLNAVIKVNFPFIKHESDEEMLTEINN